MYFSQFELPVLDSSAARVPKDALTQELMVLDHRKLANLAPPSRHHLDPANFYRVPFRNDLVGAPTYCSPSFVSPSFLDPRASRYSPYPASYSIYPDYFRQQHHHDGKMRMMSDLASGLENSRFAEHLQRLRDQHLQSKCTGSCCSSTPYSAAATAATVPCMCCLQGQPALCPRTPLGCLGTKDAASLYGLVPPPPTRPSPFCTLLGETPSSVASSLDTTGATSLLQGQAAIWTASLSNPVTLQKHQSSPFTPVSKKKDEFKPWKEINNEVIDVDDDHYHNNNNKKTKNYSAIVPPPAKIPRLDPTSKEEVSTVRKIDSYSHVVYKSPPQQQQSHPVLVPPPLVSTPYNVDRFPSLVSSAFVQVGGGGSHPRITSPVRYLPDETKSTRVEDKTVLKKLLASDPQLGLSEPTGTEVDIPLPAVHTSPIRLVKEEAQCYSSSTVEQPKPVKSPSPQKTTTSQDPKTFRKRLLAKLYQQQQRSGELSWRHKRLYQVRRRRLKSGLDMIARPKKKKSLAPKTNTSTTAQTPSLSSPVKDLTTPSPQRALHVNKSLGETTLHRAAKLGYVDVVQLALESVPVDARDNAGYTALHEASARGHIAVVRVLLQHGADANASAAGGIRPIHDAVENQHIEIVRLLLSYGGDPKIATYSGLNALKLARTQIMRQFLEGFIADVSGDVPLLPWRFQGSASCLDGPHVNGGDLWDDLPSDDEGSTDEFQFEVSEIPHLPTYRLQDLPTSHIWVRLADVLRQLRVTKEEFNDRCPQSRVTCVPRRTFELAATCNQLLVKPSSSEDNELVELISLDSPVRTILGIETVALR